MPGRDIPGKYTTIEMLAERAKVAGRHPRGSAEWKDKGIVIEDVSMQEVRYSDAVKTRFEEAQNAQTEVVKAQADLEEGEGRRSAEDHCGRGRGRGEPHPDRIARRRGFSSRGTTTCWRTPT